MGLTRSRLLALLAPLVVLASAGGGYAVGQSRASSDISAPAGSEGLPEPTEAQLRSVDIGFVTDMLDHHDQIVGLANFAAGEATSDMVRSLATGIIASQQYEKGLMESYLRAHGVSRPQGEDRTVMAWMGTPMPKTSMPGYISKADEIAFYNLRGPDLDRRFLELTIQHHEGGVHMAEDARARTADPWLRDLADLMVVEQRTEINDARSALS